MKAKYYGADLPDFKANGYTFDTTYTANVVVLSAGFNFLESNTFSPSHSSGWPGLKALHIGRNSCT